MKLYPLKFAPITKEKIWGREYWLLSSLKGDESVVANGPLQGRRVDELIAEFEEPLLGKGNGGNTFPLLIKVIEAEDKLSVQVHPSDYLARKRGLASGKSEMWYVMDAQPEAKLVAGLTAAMTPKEYEQRVAYGSLTEVLRAHKVKQGDVFNIPAGRVHAIGSGITLAEIQQPCDVTYRIYDYQRKDAAGHYRDLHLAEAKEAIYYQDTEDDVRVHYTQEKNKPVCLTRSRHFSTYLYEITEKGTYDLSAYQSAVVFVCVEGACTVHTEGTEAVALTLGELVLIPSTIHQVTIIPEGKVTLLATYKPRKYMKKAMITGVTGQDGSYLSEFLLEKGYEVHGIIRRSSVDYRERIAHLEGHPHFHLHYADMGDSMSLVKIVGTVRPDEIYNLAAQSHVQVSFDSPEYTADVDAVGVLRILEAVRTNHLENTCRIYQASTSELYGKVEEVPQNENTPFHPYSPYAVAKLYGFWIIKEYREAYGMYCASGILFNHESERRGETFVTRKITLAAARIAQGKQEKVYLGNLDSMRDWGYARDYVECMWLILQQKKAEDFVIATGVQHSVREFCYLAFKHAGIELEFKGEGLNEVGICKATLNPKLSTLNLEGKALVEVSPDFYRPTDVVNLWGDPTKAKAKLGWNPAKTSFEELVKLMVEADMAKVAAEGAASKVRTNLAEYLEKGVVK